MKNDLEIMSSIYTLGNKDQILLFLKSLTIPNYSQFKDLGINFLINNLKFHNHIDIICNKAYIYIWSPILFSDVL